MQKVREFTYQKLTPEEQRERGILGRLVGTIADFKHPTRNERLYTEELWDKVFDDPLMKEKIENKTVFGELGHPTDREEIDMEKIAISLAETPKKLTDGTIHGVFDILDTPNGRILKTLCDYGCKIGVSSRGTGDIIEDWNGNSKVDPSTYQCECWDAVLVPSVKSARPDYVHESLGRDSKLRKALNEELIKSTPEAKKVMEETLSSLNIDYSDNQLNEEVNTHKNVENKVVSDDTPIAADNIGADVIKSLQESLKQVKALQEQVKSLQEKLSVCNAKESELSESLATEKRKSIQLKRDNADMRGKIDSLGNQLAEKDKLIESQKRQISKAEKATTTKEEETNSLNESLKNNESEIQRLTEKLDSERKNFDSKVQSLKESLEDSKQDLAIKTKEFNKKLATANKLVERYKRVAYDSVDRYIESKAKIMGISESDIRNKLSDKFTLNDVDRVCEDLEKYNLDMESLPFSVNKNSTVSVKLPKSNNPYSPNSGYNDVIDEQLVYLANK